MAGEEEEKPSSLFCRLIQTTSGFQGFFLVCGSETSVSNRRVPLSNKGKRKEKKKKKKN